MARKTKEEALETRNRILDAAEIVFQRNGVSRTTLADIASEASVTRGAIYWHFEHKVDLYNAMIQRIIAPFEQRLDELQSHQHDNPLTFVRALVLSILHDLVHDPRHFRVFEIAWHKCEYVGEMAKIRDQHMECGHRFLGIMEKALKLAQERNFLSRDTDARQAAVGLMALMDGLVVNWTLDPQLFSLDAMAENLVDIFFKGLGVKTA
jgi:TetR/AcrR family acrAB operon transcriptional repressor